MIYDSEDFIVALQKVIDEENLCVYPEKQTYTCIDCYFCRLDFFNKVRQELAITNKEEWS